MLKRILLPMFLIGIIFSANAMKKEEKETLDEIRTIEKGLKENEKECKAQLKQLKELEEGFKSLEMEKNPKKLKSIGENLRNLLSAPEINTKELLRRSKNVAFKAQEENLNKEDSCDVNYNPTQNSIVAWSSRDSSDCSRSVTITVIKYLNNGRFETMANLIEEGFFEFTVAADPLIVKKLKQKISEFEANM